MTNTPKNKRQLSAELTQNKIKNTVVALMCDKNFEKITIREICKVAGVSVGTFYLYFESKEAALLYSHRYIENLYDDIDFSKYKNPVEVIRYMMWLYFKSITNESLEYIKHIYIAHITCYSDDMFSSNRKMFTLMNKVIISAKEQGLIKDNINSEELFRKLMLFARGQVYDYCINPVNADTSFWLSNAFNDWDLYLGAYLTESMINQLGSEFTEPCE